MRLGTDGGIVQADPNQLEQVVVNLVVNAGDAMPEGGTLTLETSPVVLEDSAPADGLGPGRYLALSVSDTGTGMTNEVKEHLFEPFFTTKPTGLGTGLGLATVYGIIKQHGGGVTVQSELGRGSTFTIYLPQVEPEVTEPEAVPAPDEERLPRGREVVLVAEDEETVRSIVVRLLHAQGYRVLEAEDGQAGLELARRHPGPIDLLLTDVMMPRMGGHELAERLRQERPDTRVLFMSGYNTEENLLRLPGCDGPVGLLPKPFTHRDLARKVREILDCQ